MQIVTTPDQLTPQWLSRVLDDAGVLNEATIRQVAVDPIGRGVIARMAKLSITYDGPTVGPASVVVKYPTDDPGSLGLARAMGMYELEVNFYRDVAPLVPDFRVPSCFGAAVEPATSMFTLVLEDLSTTAIPLQIGPDSTVDDKRAACGCALGELVRFQAPLWNSPQVDKLDWLADTKRTVGMFEAMARGLGPFIERFGPALSTEHVDFFERYLPRAGEWVRGWRSPTVVQHGDFRSDNLLVAPGRGAPVVTVIDFQTVRLGPPGVDAAYLIGSTFSTEERRVEEKGLISAYHDGLLAAGIKGFDLDACWRSYREGALYGAFLFVGLAAQVESVPEIDAYIAAQAARYADMAIDLEAPAAAGLA